MTLPVAVLLAVAALAQSGAPAKLPAEFETAIKCRAYSPVLGTFLTSQQTQKFEAYWIAKTEKLGKANGRTAQQVYASTLTIPIKSEEADTVIASCLKLWAADSKEPL